MKERIYIFVTIITIALCYAFDAYVHHCRTYEEPAQRTEDTLTGNGKTSDRYVDYNFAFCAGGSGSSISAQRTSSTSNIPRNTGVGKRIHDTDSAPVLLKAGKPVGISAVNNFLGYLNCWEFQMIQTLEVTDKPQPELTRNEYLRMLQAANLLGKEKTYFLIKVFAVMGIAVQELPLITVEALRNRSIIRTGNQNVIRIPNCLREEQEHG